MELLFIFLLIGIFILLEMAFKKLFGISLFILVLLIIGLDCG